jgi:hypothetical protein
MQPVHKVKDNAYKLIFGEPEMFIEFLDSFIPIEMLKHLKPDDIEDISERFLPLFSDNKDSDTVKRIRLSNDEPLFVIGIIEHESEVNFTASFKMLQYITYVLTDYVKENDRLYEKELKEGKAKLKHSTSKDFKLPPVLPIIFYDGKTRWTSSLNLLNRTSFADIFQKYIPKFEYELVDLNKYSRDDLVSYGNLLSFIFLVDKVREAEDFDLLGTLPETYLNKLNLNVPDHLLKLLEKCIILFLMKAGVEEEQIETITEKLYKRRFVDMFDVNFSIKEIKSETAKEAVNMRNLEIAKNALKEGLSLDLIRKITGLDDAFLNNVKLEYK